MSETRRPGDVLRRIAFLLEAANEPGFRVRAFRRAANAIEVLPAERVERMAASGRLTDLAGVGETTAGIIAAVLRGETPEYLTRLEDEYKEPEPVVGDAALILATLRGDCHTHSDWSDGQASIPDMAHEAIALGREYMVLTDHSPRLTVANGLSAERLEQQLEVVARLNEELSPFRILTGIEVDILDEGELDQSEELLSRLDLVVGSAHSKLRMEREGMTRRFLNALANPHLDVLGHCTGRLIVGRGRPESTFDAQAVFEQAVKYDKAIEINSRPERLDPPRPLLMLATALGCRFAIDSDAHTPGQLSWLRYGCELAALEGLEASRIVNAMGAEELVAWTRGHDLKSV
jgi:putative hydrolase